MDFCKYHPLAGATYVCRPCHIHHCNKCVDDREGDAARCFICSSVTESLGAANNVEPFWRRMPDAFKYPLNTSAMSLIVITSLVSVVASVMSFFPIFGILIYLFASGALLKYSFNCLERTALGEMKAPDVIDAYQGGIRLLLHLLVMIIGIAVVVGVAGYYLGQGLGGLVLVLAIVSFPAILIRFAQTENMLEAMNPLAAFSLITAIGLPYGVLIAFVLIMISSIGVLHEIIGTVVPGISYLLQGIVSSYYMVVIFHIMGYVLFQYQGQLGYVAQPDSEKPHKSDIEHLAARIEVFLKEGDYEQVVELYYQAFKRFPNENSFYEKYFELLYACKKTALMEDYATDYLAVLIRKNRLDKITIAYKQVLELVPGFIPQRPEVRLQLAHALKRQGDLKLAIKNLNGMHKLFPEFTYLADAYQLLAESLDDVPGMQVHAAKCREWIVQYHRKAAEKTAQLEREKEIEASQSVEGHGHSGAKSKRINPALKTSGLILELVPIDIKNDQ